MINPIEKRCWRTCKSCYRCADKGRLAACSSCSGRNDPKGRKDPYDIDDRCRCTEGILQYRLSNGRLVIQKFPHDPFGGTVVREKDSQDQRDWEEWLDQERERRNDPDFDPISFY